jgi:hypothetical protein
MAERTNITAFIRLGLVDYRLMLLAWNLKRAKRTYLSYATLNSLACNVSKLQKRANHPLQISEFGVGRGGSATLLAWMVNKYRGRLTLYDVFGRIPAPTAQDGERAIHRYDVILEQEEKDYYGNINNLLEVVSRDLYRVCAQDRIEIIQGRYEEILPGLCDQREFDFVHIDCDWYKSSMAVYQYLRSRLRPGAIIQIDDYSNWDGSKRAYQDAGWLDSFHTHIVDGALVVDTSISRNVGVT